MPRGSKPGERRGGRKIGTPNKVTEEARDAFRMVYEGRLKDLNRWLVETADGFECIHFLANGAECKYIKRDPGRAAELLIRMAEHFIPKLGRVEHTGRDGDNLVIHIKTFGEFDGG